MALTLYSAFLVRFFSPGVMANDDILMMAFSNGDFTGSPEAQLVFIGPLIGGLLKLLYTVNSTLPWYALLFVFIQIFSGSLLLTVVFNFKRAQSNRTFVAFAGLIMVLTPSLVLELSFSTTAMYASVIGLTSLAFLSHGFKDQGLVITALIGVLLIVASSLRFEFLLAAGLLIFPIYLLGVTKSTKLMKLFTLGMLFLPLGPHFIEDQISNRDGWAEYNRFNELRGSMHGTPGFSQFVSTAYEDETITKIREFGWESEDLRLFAGWYFEDAHLFSTSSLERLKQNINVTSSPLPFQSSLEGIIYGREFLILFGLASAVFGASLSVPRFRNFLLFQVSWFLIVALLVSSRARFPDRFALGAFFGLFIALLASNMILARRQSMSDEYLFSDKKFEVSLFVCFIIATVFLIPHKFSAEQLSINNQNEASRLTSEIEIFDDIDSKGIFVDIYRLAIEGINPWTERTVFHGNRLLALGWNSQSPHQEKRKSAMNLEGNFLSNFVNAPNLYFVATEETTKLLQHSFEKRKGRQINFVHLGNLTYASVYKVVDTTDDWETVPNDSDLDN